MNRAALWAHLVDAEEAVEQGERHLSRQRRLIASLERNGHDPGAAYALLATFEDSQALHVFDRDRLRRELAQALR
jgi:hypothetical protein